VKAGREARVAPFLRFAAGHEVLLLDIEAAVIAGRLYAGLESQGTPIGRIDPIIAAVALRNQLVLVTGNTAHYQRVRVLGFDLVLDDWKR
jgi:tRNA(fMet)-specific endonuclease VapC